MTPVFLRTERRHDPRTPISLPWGENIDFDAILADARRNRTCAECGGDLNHVSVPRSLFCSPKHRYAFRDRRRYLQDAEAMRAKSRRYYEANRERILEKAAAKRGQPREPERMSCSECDQPLTGRQRVTCGSAACRDARFRRLHPDAYEAREMAKVDRRREHRRKLREGGADA